MPTRPSAPRRGALRGRIVLLLPGEAIFPGVPVPRVCSTVPEVDAAIREAMTLASAGGGWFGYVRLSIWIQMQMGKEV